MRQLLLMICMVGLRLVFCTVTAQYQRYEVIIDEIMADPSPPVVKSNGLPESEYIELRNNSKGTIDLMGWRIADPTGSATIKNHFLLKPDSVVTVCSNTSVGAFTKYGSVIGVSNFPSLDNETDLLIVISREGQTIFAVEYLAGWYNNPVKLAGGWSLEMTDVHSPCITAGNWVASDSPLGGTPGRKNSVNGSIKDDKPPALIRSFATDSLHVKVLFDEAMEERSAQAGINYSFEDPGVTIASASMDGPLFNSIVLTIVKPLKRNSVYWLTVKNISDCAGNRIAEGARLKTALAAVVDSGGVVINEMLFNPSPPGADYVELYNAGQNTIDLQHLLVANRSAAGAASAARQISTQPRLLFPGDYCVVTEDPSAVQKQFIAKNPAYFSQLSSMPSYPDDRGTMLVLNSKGKIFDEVQYDEKWHFPLITEREGIALERIDPGKPAGDRNNWHSAAASAGYGTPTYRNSQQPPLANTDNGISVLPKLFSPDNDGRDDFTTIQYRFPDPGYVCNIVVYDALGNLVRNIARNFLCGREGYFRWDGLNNADRKVSTGTYVLLCEVFALNGLTKRSRHVLVIATKF